MKLALIKKSITLIVFVFLTYTYTFSQCGLWTLGSAKTIDRYALKVGITTPIRYGLMETIELQSHLWAMYPLPNIAVKKQWYEFESGWIAGSLHGFSYPTPAYRLYANNSIVPLQPIATGAAHLLQVKNEVRFSKILKKKDFCNAANHMLTLRAGNMHVFGLKDTLKQALDYPLLYRTTAIADQKSLLFIGADLEAWIGPYVNYSVDLDFYFLIPRPNYWFIESKALLYGKIKDNQTLHGGIKLVAGNYPSGFKFDVLPVVEYIFHFKFKESTKNQKGLTPEILSWKVSKKKKKKKKDDE